MAPPTTVNIGVDSSATIAKGTALIEHQAKRLQHKLEGEDGTLELGGNYSPLHRESPWKRPWQLMKDGDLWRSFYETVASTTPAAVK